MSRAPEPIIRVPEGFDQEFPEASRLATEVFINIGVLVGAVQSCVDRLLAAEGLPSAAAFNVLSVLGGDPEPLRPSLIASRMMVTRATTTGLLDTLERRGLVRRLAVVGDGRARPVALTDTGRQLVARLVPEMHRFERQLMDALTEHQLRQLRGMVATLQARIASLQPEATFGIR
jgi:DNA-binding MarR family transcriptional regulator